MQFIDPERGPALLRLIFDSELIDPYLITVCDSDASEESCKLVLKEAGLLDRFDECVSVDSKRRIEKKNMLIERKTKKQPEIALLLDRSWKEIDRSTAGTLHSH